MRGGNMIYFVICLGIVTFFVTITTCVLCMYLWCWVARQVEKDKKIDAWLDNRAR